MDSKIHNEDSRKIKLDKKRSNMNKEVLEIKNEIKHTAHSSYRCEYHIVFAPKYRRKVIYNQLRKDVGEIMRKL